MSFTRPTNKLYRFLNGSDGTVALIFALAVIPMFLVAGLALDFIRASQSQTQLQAVLDAAVLAVAKAEGVPLPQRKERGIEFFKHNFQANGREGAAIPKFEIKRDRVVGSVKLQLPTTLLRLTGNTSLEIAATAEAMRPITGSAEVVLVLDYSHSMETNNKYGRMAAVAKDFIDQLRAETGSASNLRFGLVPFSDMVAVDLPLTAVLQERLAGPQAGEWKRNTSGVWQYEPSDPANPITGEWTGCAQDREYPYNQTASSPVKTNEKTKWGKVYHLLSSGPGGQNVEEACSQYLNRNLKIAPLSSNHEELKDTLAAMTPYWNTNITLGAEFGWHMLTPNSPFNAQPFTKKGNHKFIVLLTDGVQTTNGRGENQAESVDNALLKLDAICRGMKDDGITVFAIGYDIDDDRILSRLKTCSSPDKYFDSNVTGSNDLAKAFKEIAEVIKASLIYLSD
jgi:Flp pilus assembly protein TadG